MYRFGANQADGDGSMRAELGGKGAGLAEMTLLGVPVPPGFTIPTSVCRYVLENGTTPPGFEQEIQDSMRWLELQRGQKFGGESDPLLVSVRSGAEISMPGMMDTILNVGLNDSNITGLASCHSSTKFALDSYRRLLQMFGSVVLGVPKSGFDRVVHAVERKSNASLDSGPDEEFLTRLIDQFKELILRHTGREFPMDPQVQLSMAIQAVFHSWTNQRARHYRRIHNLSEECGTAVTIQAMVFGNYGPDSGTGVGFTRNPSIGDAAIFGEFLSNAQGEDIVAGTRTPVPISELGRTMPKVYRQLRSVVSRLEPHYRDMQDFEFTVQKGELFLLQTRAAKRSALAAVRCAVEMAEEGLISREEAVGRVDPNLIGEILSPQLDLSSVDVQPITRGLPASPGSACGKIALSADRAVAMAGKHRETPVILVRQETNADDIHGMDAAVGFLTARGGATSHAAVVARGMGKCCITGAGGIIVDERAGIVRINDLKLCEGDWLSLDGLSGQVFACEIPLRPANSRNAFLDVLLDWAHEIGGMPVRANADTPEDARRSKMAGASGIGLCRTEHMFFAQDRLPHVRAMILAENTEERQSALNKLLPMQQEDFEALFRHMCGLPVTIRLIDPPLHEFLPAAEELNAAIADAKKHGATQDRIRDLQRMLARTRELVESNPMMGHRGCRLGITFPEIIAMQVKAALQAALAVQAKGIPVSPEIMVPLVACVEEIRCLRRVVDDAAAQVFTQEQDTVDYKFGAMIELPRAAVCAASIATEVDFLSFGTNDLTQMTFGFSRDDARKFLDAYLDLGILKKDPFISVDREGVGALIQMAIQQARFAHSGIKIGVCGEHGGDPESIEFFQSIGVDYVSCSPARIPVAQLAAARAAAFHTVGQTAPAQELPVAQVG
ncbi:MAG TPA: pyruvate, phosphate dikinase [Acidobacteriaceae bacterium]|jgi:pyruvate,orthophosphate dikinase|nr:pyruvate, phosphate dikinase [Acidobacteriaceae bacterium]